MPDASTLLHFKTNTEGKVDYLYRIGTLVVKHSVTMEEARRICGDHPITACDLFPSYPCNVRGNYYFPPLLTEFGEWPLKGSDQTDAIAEDAPPVDDTPVEVPAPAEETTVEEAPKPVKPKAPAKRKTAKPATARKKVQK